MKKVLITGASSGIGLQLTNDYLQQGWQVIACGRDFSKSQLDHDIWQHQLSIKCFDISDTEQCEQHLMTIMDLDLAILNAGRCEYVDNASILDSKLFSRVINSNLLGTINCLAPIINNIRHNGRIAIMSSSVTFVELPRAEAYGASKAALNYLCRSLAIDLAPKGIHFSLIQPGFVDTPLTEKNNFPMPGLISMQQASSTIISGLAKGKSLIAFPFSFILILRILSCLPWFIWQRVATQFIRRTS